MLPATPRSCHRNWRASLAQEESGYQLEYLLGLLNSTLWQWRFKLTSTNNNVGTNELEGMPFRRIDFGLEADGARHNRMVFLVQRMLELEEELSRIKVAQERTAIQRRLRTTVAAIERLVYELYDLSREQVNLVEGTVEEPALVA